MAATSTHAHDSNSMMSDFAGNGEIQWCFSQVKGTLDDDVSEGKNIMFVFFSCLVLSSPSLPLFPIHCSLVRPRRLSFSPLSLAPASLPPLTLVALRSINLHFFFVCVLVVYSYVYFCVFTLTSPVATLDMRIIINRSANTTTSHLLVSVLPLLLS